MDDDDIRDIFAGVGPVAIKRMFGGKGIYSDGLIFALDIGDGLLLKADAVSAPDFAAAGSRQWVYDGKTKPVAMPYWTVPESALDDPDEMTGWARKAIDASHRSQTGKKPGRR
jgi:DNA transformation protein